MLHRLKTLLWFVGIFLVAGVAVQFLPSEEKDEVPEDAVEQTQVTRQKQKQKQKMAALLQSQDRLHIFQEQRSSPGLTLIPTSGTAEVLLVDHQGNLIHHWDVDAARARLLPNGHILVVHGSTWGESVDRWRDLMHSIIEYDWEGKEVWRFNNPHKTHHDVRRLPSGHTVFLDEVSLPEEKRMLILDKRRRKLDIASDRIVEVSSEGEVVWTWGFHDHFDPNYCGLRPCYSENSKELRPKKLRDWTHTNSLFPLPENKWFDSGDERFRPGNYLVLPRRFWMPLIVDRQSNEIVWKYDKQEYNGGLGAPHEVQMIEKGLPGAGNILLLDNGPGSHPDESYVIELNPQTLEVVWAYNQGKEFFNPTRGSVQRLRNGNTLISWDREGRVIEVTPEQEVVWELRVPTELTRARRYEYDYCQRCTLSAQAHG